MYSSAKTIIVKIGVVFTLLFILSSCFKEIEEVDNLNTNIFDREYAGEQWFEITDVFFYSNILGQNKVRAVVLIPEENVPLLKPSYISIYLTGDGIGSTHGEIPQSADGGYKTVVDLPYEGLITYCISLSIYLEEEDEAINTFEDCFEIE